MIHDRIWCRAERSWLKPQNDAETPALYLGGLAAGLFSAGLVALFAGALSNAFEGVGQELFNALVLAIAVVMLTWHNVWMARHGRELSAELRRVGGEVSNGSRSLMALAVVVAVAVARRLGSRSVPLWGRGVEP